MLSCALFSSSDDEDEYTVAEMNTLRREIRNSSNIFSMPNSKFVSYFRLNKSAFKYVLDMIEPKLKESKRTSAVPNILKLAATMRILAEGSYQKGAGNDYNVGLSQSSVSKVFKECINAMNSELCKSWISFKMSENEKFEIKEHFYNKTGFPGVIGCIDGTHIKILAPKTMERFKYYNRKGFFSLNATIVCDHKLQIRYIASHYPGSAHDSLIWNASELKQFLKTNHNNGDKNTWILGDAGYPLEPFLITPFRSAAEGTPESRFNHIHSQTRNVVERTIGVLKNRFRCILGARQLHYSPKVAAKITNVCAALHNICIYYKMDLPEINIENNIRESFNIETTEDLTASSIRMKIMQSMNL
ncbi:putative nuclease HARBI1 [Calliphora vicina]|uniref:putative nuclease HARBI1 n=1 Tax=Calliphora vicina TaxID=7373 RepID=UPI00325A4E3C